MLNTSILTIVIVTIVAMKQVSSYTESCIGEFCFTTPDSNELTNFAGAKSWCNDKNSALAVLNNREAQLALTQFLTSSNTSAMTFINIKLYQQAQANTWFIANGSKYNGAIGNQGNTRNAEYKLYGYLKLYGNYFQVDASKPNETNRYTCDYDDSRCLDNATNNILYNGRCYVKYENESLTWYQARERCVNNGADLAQFQYDFNPRVPNLGTLWLNSSLTYWVGIRWNDRRWKSPDDGNEAIYTSWSSGEPNTYDYQCVCVDPNGNPAWSWTDCNCSETRQFVCLKIVPTTTTSTTTTTIRAPSVSTTSEVIAGINPNSTTNALAIGLGVGLGGGVFIILVVVLVVVVVMIMKKRKGRSRNGVESTNNVEHNHEHPMNVTRNFPTADSDFYATIVPTAKNQSYNMDASQSNIIYSTPDFTQNQISESSSSDPTNTRRGKVQSIMLDGPSDVYANTASVS